MNDASHHELTEIRNGKIYVAGHRGMVGSALVTRLKNAGCTRIVTRTRDELDLTDQSAVEQFMADEHPDYVFLAAARVGGIYANNTFPADFIYDNLLIAANVIKGAYDTGAKRLLFLGSSCIYPQQAPQPMTEECLLTGHLEPTNEPYAIAKIAGIKMCESFNRQFGTDFRSIMPTNLYGPNDNFDLKSSHVLPALIRKFHEAKINNEQHVEVWGSGNARREFLHVNDLADACFLVMSLPTKEYHSATKPMVSHINAGTGIDITIEELAISIKEIVGFSGRIDFNPEQPEGTPRKLLDITKLQALGWQARISLRDGITDAYHWYLEHCDNTE